MLHTDDTVESTGIQAIVNSGITYFPSVPLEPRGKGLQIESLYRVTGTITKVRDSANNEIFVFNVKQTVEIPE